jgi:hypothetical protein
MICLFQIFKITFIPFIFFPMIILAFRCCYCYKLNEAKKQRPSAPPLEGLSTPTQNHSTNDTVGNEETCGESENIEKTVEGTNSV